MTQTRRTAIKQLGLLSAVAMGASSPLDLLAGNNPAAGRLRKFGIQLYSVRDVLPRNPAGVIRELARMGYGQIESYEAGQGIFWGMKPKEFSELMKDCNLEALSSHCDTGKEFERKAAEAAEVGMKYLICPWKGPQKDLDTFRRFADEFNRCGEICKKNGIRFAYHNHAYSFKPVEGSLPQDIMMQGTDAALVDFEMDIYWVVTAGQDPEQWLKKYPNRFRLCHVKDRAKNASSDEAFCNLGDGAINFQAILHTAKKYGMQHYIVEQEGYPHTTSMDAAAANVEYMKKLRI